MRQRPQILTLALFIVIASCLIAIHARAQPKVTSQGDATYKIHMETGETRLIRLSEKIVRISIADPKVADVRVVTPLQVLVTAKSVGFTHLILWGETDQPLVVAVTCRRNLNDLRSQLKELFPKEQIKISSAGDLVVMSGKVSDLRLPSRLAQVAKLHSEKLANLVEVSGNQQVQLEVRFAEVSRTGLRRMGINFLWRDAARGYTGSLAGPAAAGQFLNLPGTSAGSGPPPIGTPMASDAFNILFSTGLSSFPFSTVLSILAQEGLAKVLAEPTLVALSGHEASFHAGGEIPILYAQQLGAVSIQFKKFGVQLKFMPTVLGEKTMSLKVFAEVSEPDYANSVTLAGYQVPGFKTRNSETTVRLRDGQSFAIAGLLTDKMRTTINKIPLLGEIPVLGALFRSTSFQRDESELLVVVRAHLTQPLPGDQVPLIPGEDQLNDPSDFQLFMLGSLGPWKREKKEESPEPEPTSEPEKQAAAGGPLGPIGFIRE